MKEREKGDYWPFCGLLDSEPVINKWVMMVVQSCMGVEMSDRPVCVVGHHF